MKMLLQIFSTVMLIYIFVTGDLWADISNLSVPAVNPWGDAFPSMEGNSGPSCNSAYVCQMKTNSWQTWKNMALFVKSGNNIVTSTEPDTATQTYDPNVAQAAAISGRRPSSEGMANYFAPKWKGLYEQMRPAILAVVNLINHTEKNVSADNKSVSQSLEEFKSILGTESRVLSADEVTDLASILHNLGGKLQGINDVLTAANEPLNSSGLSETKRLVSSLVTPVAGLVAKTTESISAIESEGANTELSLMKISEFETAYQAYQQQLETILVSSMNEANITAYNLQRDEAHWLAAIYLTMEGEFSGSYDDKRSSDGKVVCKAEGPETQDYDACKTMADLYDGARVAEVGVQGVQQVLTVNEQMNIQRDYNERVQEGDYAAGLRLQSDTMAMQRDQAAQQSGFHAAKLATLWGAMESMPTIESITERCVTKMTSDGKGQGERLRFFQALFGSIDPPSVPDLNPVHICNEVVTSSNNKFIMNQQAIAAIRDEMIKAGFDTAKMAGMAAVFQVQKDKIDNAIDDLNTFEPTDIALDPAVLEQAKCLADPTLPGCVEGIYDRDVGFGENVFNVGGTDGMNGVNTVNGTDSASGSDAVGDGSATGSSVKALGSINTVGAKDSGIAGYVPGAARVKSSPKASPGGGGGGAGGASMASGGGAGGADRAGSSAVSDVSKLKYGTGGTGALNYGKSAAALPKKAKAENPFSKLFNKDKGPSASGEEMNFGRNPASVGDKDGKSIFEMISGRYSVVNGREDLLIYEKKE